MEKATRIKFDRKVQRLCCFAIFHGSSTIWIVAMAFDIHNSVEIRVSNFNGDRHAICQTIDNNVWSRERLWWWYWFWNWY